MYVHGFRFFSPLAGVLFAFPSRYWFTIGQSGVFSLGGWSPYSDRIPRVPPYSSSSQHVCFRVRDYHPVPSDFPDRSTNTQDKLIQTPGCSPFARRYWGISVDFFLGVLRCFSSPVRLVNPCIQLTIVQRIALGFPFGHRRVKGSYHLAGAFRRLARPSSPLTAGIHRVRLVA